MMKLPMSMSAASLLLLTSMSAAQGQQDVPRQSQVPLPFSAPATSFIPSGLGAVTLEATEVDSALTARVAYEVGDLLIFGRLSAKLDNGAKEVTLSTLDELNAPTLATFGASYQFAKVATSATKIEQTCTEFRRDVFARFSTDRPTFRPILIENGECSLDNLDRTNQDLFFGALRERNKKLNALCDDYNSKRGGGKLLATRLDDQADPVTQAHDAGVPLHFEAGAEALARTFGKSCTVANLIAAVEDEARRTATEKPDEAAAAARKNIEDQLGKSILPVCQSYNDHAYPLLRKLEPEGALPDSAPPDRGCEYDTIRDLLTNQLFSEEFRNRWLQKLDEQFPFRFWSFTASLTEGKNEFTIFDPARFDPVAQDPIKAASRDVTKTSRNLTAGLTYFSKLWSLGLGYVKKMDVKSPSKTDICVPINGSVAERCFSGLIQDPGEEEADIVTFEAKSFFSRKLGVQLRVLHDLEMSDTEPHVSFYLLNQEGRGLTGGIELFYSNETKNLEGRVFVGAAFSIFPSGS